MKRSLLIYIGIVLVFLTVPTITLAQNAFSIPVDSWIYNAIEELQTSGYLLGLSPGFRPYTRDDVADALNHLVKQRSISKMPMADRWLLRKLEKEFSYELKMTKAKEFDPDTVLTGGTVSEEDFLNLAKGDYGTFKYARKTEFRPLLRTGFGLNVGNHLILYTDATINQTLKDDSLYTGSTKFGLDALHQQAYIRYSNRYLEFTFGRDYLSWGYGDDGKVMVSSTAGALDMASLFIRTHVFKFNWFVAQLNSMPEFTPDTTDYSPFGPAPTTGQPDPTADRYFTGSRAEFNIGDRIFIGAYQAALFGGPYASISFDNINPVRLNYEATANNHLSGSTNNFLGFDLSVFWPRGVNFYGNLMIDDWQVDRATKGDLKPDLYAIQTGIRTSDILQTLGVTGTNVSLQYMMAGNRVYNEYNWQSFQKLLLGNYPIANPFGDDFWNLDLRLSQWLSYDWKFSVDIMHYEHGSANIYSPYTMPWLTDPNVTLQTGYHEPFPYGVIQETDIVRMESLFQPGVSWYGEVSVIYSHSRNANYIQATTKSGISFVFTFYYKFSGSFLFE